MVAALVGLLGVVLGSGMTWVGQWLMASRQQTNLFRLAAIEKRLAVHQEAFVWWRRFVEVSLLDQPSFWELLTEGNAWWVANSLYLAPGVRREFQTALLNLSLVRGEDRDTATSAREQVLLLGPLIEEAVGLPSIGKKDEDASKGIRSEGPKQGRRRASLTK